MFQSSKIEKLRLSDPVMEAGLTLKTTRTSVLDNSIAGNLNNSMTYLVSSSVIDIATERHNCLQTDTDWLSANHNMRCGEHISSRVKTSPGAGRTSQEWRQTHIIYLLPELPQVLFLENISFSAKFY